MIDLMNKIFAIQLATNEVYSGSEWAKINRSKWRLAAMVEISEFLSEVAEEWCWWKPTKNNTEAAVKELVDSVAFMLSVLYVDHKMALNKGSFFTKSSMVQRGEVKKTFTQRFPHKNAGGYIVEYDSPIEYLDNCLGRVLYGNMMVERQIALVQFIECASQFLGLDEDDFLKAFEDKHQVYIKRVNSGYKETGIKPDGE